MAGLHFYTMCLKCMFTVLFDENIGSPLTVSISAHNGKYFSPLDISLLNFSFLLSQSRALRPKSDLQHLITSFNLSSCCPPKPNTSSFHCCLNPVTLAQFINFFPSK